MQLCENEQKNLAAMVTRHSKEREDLKKQIQSQEKTIRDMRESLDEKASQMEGTVFMVLQY